MSDSAKMEQTIKNMLFLRGFNFKVILKTGVTMLLKYFENITSLRLSVN